MPKSKVVEWEWVWSGEPVESSEPGRARYSCARIQNSDGYGRDYKLGDVVVVNAGRGKWWLAQILDLFEETEEEFSARRTERGLKGVRIDRMLARNIPLRKRCTFRWFEDASGFGPGAKREGLLPPPTSREFYFSSDVEMDGFNCLNQITGRAWLFETAEERDLFEADPDDEYLDDCDQLCVARGFVNMSSKPPTIRPLRPGELAIILKYPSSEKDLYHKSPSQGVAELEQEPSATQDVGGDQNTSSGSNGGSDQFDNLPLDTVVEMLRVQNNEKTASENEVINLVSDSDDDDMQQVCTPQVEDLPSTHTPEQEVPSSQIREVASLEMLEVASPQMLEVASPQGILSHQEFLRNVEVAPPQDVAPSPEDYAQEESFQDEDEGSSDVNFEDPAQQERFENIVAELQNVVNEMSAEEQGEFAEFIGPAYDFACDRLAEVQGDDDEVPDSAVLHGIVEDLYSHFARARSRDIG